MAAAAYPLPSRAQLRDELAHLRRRWDEIPVLIARLSAATIADELGLRPVGSFPELDLQSVTRRKDLLAELDFVRGRFARISALLGELGILEAAGWIDCPGVRRRREARQPAVTAIEGAE